MIATIILSVVATAWLSLVETIIVWNVVRKVKHAWHSIDVDILKSDK